MQLLCIADCKSLWTTHAVGDSKGEHKGERKREEGGKAWKARDSGSETVVRGPRGRRLVKRRICGPTSATGAGPFPYPREVWFLANSGSAAIRFLCRVEPPVDVVQQLTAIVDHHYIPPLVLGCLIVKEA